MKVLLINGSPHKEGCTNEALCEVAKTLEKNGIETVTVHIGTKPIAGCIACGSCKKTGKCFVNDDKVNEIIDILPEIDGIVVGSPVYYAAPSGQICAFLDRLFFAGSGFAGKVGAAVVSCRRGGATAAFDVLNKYFAISSMPIATSQYWNQVHGSTPEDVRKDEEGLQTMRTLGNNMAWMLKCFELGKKNGITIPEREKQIRTNFIR
ncbi:MAG: flavodoxin family protein [Monoglobales bacterium]